MTPLAPLISAFLNQRLPLERRASDHTCEAYAYAFQLLFVYAAERLKVPPCELVLEQLDAPLIVDGCGSFGTTLRFWESGSCGRCLASFV
jgi:hypothetical protein